MAGSDSCYWLIKRGIRSNSWLVKEMSSPSIQWPEMRITSATPATLGTNVRVTSWICVTDWNSDTARPMAKLVTRIGAETFAVTVIIRSAISMTVVSVMGPQSVETCKEGLDHEGPSIDEYEQQDLERERHQHRGQHHHPHRHQRRAHYEVDDQERYEHDEADDECRFQLRQHERGDERGHADIVRCLWLLLAGCAGEHGELGLAGLLEHELPQRLDAPVVGLALRDLAVHVRLHRVLVHLRQRRAHHE